MFVSRSAGVLIACVTVFSSGEAYAAPAKAAAQVCTPQTGGKSALSGLALPRACTTAKPAGAVGGLTVLPWAGFKGAVSYTFDDMLPSQIQNYGVLSAPGIPMTFYVSKGRVGTDPSNQSLIDQWRAVARDNGNEIGNHTTNHCNVDAAGTTLTNCNFGTGGQPDAGLTTAADQISDTNAFITGSDPATQLGMSGVYTMAAPFGDGKWSTPAASANFIANRGVWNSTPSAFVAAADNANVLNLPCFSGGSHSSGWGMEDSQASLDQVVNDARGRQRWAIFLFHGVSPNEGASWDPSGNWTPTHASYIAGSMNKLKQWGDVWGDTVVNVAAYQVAQKLLADAAPVTANGSTTWTWNLPTGFPPGKYLRVTVTGGTLSQGGQALAWNDRGFYEIALDAGSLTLAP
jgi:hypothetical protein